jgi:hypothetical protein
MHEITKYPPKKGGIKAGAKKWPKKMPFFIDFLLARRVVPTHKMHLFIGGFITFGKSISVGQAWRSES